MVKHEDLTLLAKLRDQSQNYRAQLRTVKKKVGTTTTTSSATEIASSSS